MSASRILVVEDSDAIRLPVQTALTARGFETMALSDGTELEATIRSFRPDLVLLDVMLPGRDGFELLPVIRRSSTAGVIMVTARDATGDRVHGLAAGADDYVVKPFAIVELLARVHAVLRRTRRSGGVVQVGELEIGDAAADVVRDGTRVELTETERRVLAYLAEHLDQVVSKTQILTAVWGYDGFDENVVEVHISALRRKLEPSGSVRVLHTVRGQGYRLSGRP